MRPLPTEPAETLTQTGAAAPPPFPHSRPHATAEVWPRPASAPPLRVRPKREPVHLVEDPFYPSSDGQPMSENIWQFDVMVDGASVLRTRYRHRRDVFAGGDLLMYYEKGDPTKRVAPDLFVIFGVGNHPRKSYRLWEEGKAPDFVLEVVSESNWREDVGRKKELYERLAMREYWMFDPQQEFLAPPLQGFALRDGQYEEVLAWKEEGVLAAHSEVLDLHLLAESRHLRFRDPKTGENLRTLEQETIANQREAATRREAELRREQAEAERDQEAAARRAAETRIKELETKLQAAQAQLAAGAH